MKALILTGPRDGQLIDHSFQVLDLPAGPHALSEYVPILRYKRVLFYDGEKYVPLFVPIEWPAPPVMEGKVLGHLLQRAFKDAAK